MLALWIILGILALVVLLLVLPLQIFLKYTPERGLQYRIKYCFWTLTDSAKNEEASKKSRKKPAEQEKSKKTKKSKSKDRSGAVSFLLSFLGLDDVSSAAKAKQSISENGLLETIGSVFTAVKNLFSRLFGLVSKGVFRKFDLSITVGDSDAADAALRYGTICAAVYPLLTLLDSSMKFRSRNVDIRCDDTQETTTAQFDGRLTYRPYSILGFAFGLIWRYLKQVLKKEGSKS